MRDRLLKPAIDHRRLGQFLTGDWVKNIPALTHSMESVITKMIDLEDEINRDIDILVDLKREIVTLIKQIKNTEYQTLLELRYLCFKSWEQIAIDLGYSSKHVFYIHDKAVALINIPIKSY
jgi:DNA-directed RNA polymerase specialized sigma subunit